jgi:hypothetical protein
MSVRNIDGLALVCLTLLLLVIEAAGNKASAIASNVAREGWCPRTMIRTVVMPMPPMPRVNLPAVRSICLDR